MSRSRALQSVASSQESSSSSSSALLLSDDVRAVLYAASTKEDLDASARVLRAFVDRSASARVKNASVQRMNRLLAWDMLLLCRSMAGSGGAEAADSLMLDQEFVAKLGLFGGGGGGPEAEVDEAVAVQGGGRYHLPPMSHRYEFFYCIFLQKLL